ncbi:class I tRNA ligase family protein, partial [Candidatus Saccharibacteria bacterium]|nr:class I tRNA ligase family protein [Candidatus Saccharibacteria bacterium]
MQRYNPSEIEPKWQKVWAKTQIYAANDFDKKPKFVMLTEFPYPSGAAMHMGHTMTYTGGDIIARYKRAQGYNVLFPMAFDAFGLPAENYAIKNKVTPQAAVEQNIAHFRAQLDRMGCSFDWNRIFATTDPEYYKWTQWFFLQFFKKGLAYQDEIAINWCPFCKTGLANEEVVNGRHERCDTLVEKKLLKQWMLRITDYADRLIDGLKDVDYPSRIADQQVNWIGKSTGAEVDFQICHSELASESSPKILKQVQDDDLKITVFTTRPDTIFGATFMVLAPEHPLVAKITTADRKDEVDTYIKTAQAKSEVERQETDHEKTGAFAGAYVINPATNKPIPVWIADYVLMGYGTGAIMAVPAHDERDYDFATKFNIPITQVVAPTELDLQHPPIEGKKNTTRKVVMCLIKHPVKDEWLTLKWPKRPDWHTLVMGGIEGDEDVETAARREIAEKTGYTHLKLVDMMPLKINSIFYAAHKDVNRDIITTVLKFELQDLKQQALQRDEVEQAEDNQQVWTPRCELEQLQPVAELPYILNWLAGKPMVYVGDGQIVNSDQFDGLTVEEAKKQVVAWLENKGVAHTKVNYKLRDWVYSRQRYWGEPIPIIHCPKCGAVAVPDDQLPVELPVVDHYEPTDDGKSPLSKIDDWVNTTCPQCGGPAKRETDTMPNWAGSNWYYLRYFDPHNNQAFAGSKELKYWSPVDLYIGGMEHTTLHLLYSRFHHQFLYDQGLVPMPEPYAARRGHGMILAADGTKMSKSKGNVVDPTQVIDSGYGADALRLAIAFLAPFDQNALWNPEGVAGTYRFLVRFWKLANEASGKSDDKTLATVHHTIKKVTEDIERMNYNTAIAALMAAVNDLNHNGVDKIATTEMEDLTKLLAPFAPHLAEEIWHEVFKHSESIHLVAWPKWQDKYLVANEVEIVVQVNGKVRAKFNMAT